MGVDVRAQLTAISRLTTIDDAFDSTAVATLTGELLPGWYDEWVLLERERLRNQQLHALEELSARLSGAGRHTSAVDAALAALAADPLRETAHRALIEAHLAEGNQGEAIRRWRSYRSLIRDRLRLDPVFSWDEIAVASSKQPRG